MPYTDGEIVAYYINRNGQQFGPYLAEDICRYLEQGALFLSDLARTDSSSSWVPLGQLVTPLDPPPPPPMFSHPTSVLAPPSLHWFLVLLITWFTGEIFFLIWAFVQSSWIRKIDPQSRATRDYILGLVMPIVGFIPLVIFMVWTDGIRFSATPIENVFMVICILIVVVGFVAGIAFEIKAIFGIKASLERYYNTVEPIGLKLSGVMTFFFNILYFQYHMTRIADWKHTGILEG